MLMQDEKYAKVEFLASWSKGKEYDYITIISDLQAGDLIVVETKDSYSVAKFVRYMDPEEENFASAYIVDKVNVQK